MRSLFSILSSLIMLPVSPACDSERCGDEVLRHLQNAVPGDEVELGACRIQGPLFVPSGVSLRGAGIGQTIVEVAGDDIAIQLAQGTEEISVRALSVESEGCAGLIAQNTGKLNIEDVVLSVRRGVALGISALDEVSITDLMIEGPVSAERAAEVQPSLAPYACSSVASHGAVFVDVNKASLKNVEISGFSAFGLLSLRSSFVWKEGGVHHGLGTGIEVWSGDAELVDVEVEGVVHGQGAVEAFGAFFGGEATIETSGMRIHDGDDFGVMHDHAHATHFDLNVSNQRFAGVWAQSSNGLRIASSNVHENRFAGIVIIDSDDIELEEIRVVDTTIGVTVIGETGALRAGDGLQFVRSSGNVAQIELEENERVGLLLELGGESTNRFDFRDVQVFGSGTQLGAIAQNGTRVDNWDAEIRRSEVLRENDAAFRGSLDIAQAVGPSCLPIPETLMTGGLEGLFRP